MSETNNLVAQIETKNDALGELMTEAGPAANTLAQHTTGIADLVQQVGATTDQLKKFPSIAGTDTSGRSVIADANQIAASWNDLVVAPDATLRSLNRLMPPLIKGTSGNSLATRASIDRLVLGSIPDIGFTGDVGLHGPKRYNWEQLVGSFKYTLWRLQERIVGKGPEVPQVPVLPSPTEPGQLVVAPTLPEAPPPPPGPEAPLPGPPQNAEAPR